MAHSSAAPSHGHVPHQLAPGGPPTGAVDLQAIAAIQGQRLQALAQHTSSHPDAAAVSAQQHAAVLALLTKWREEALRQHKLRLCAEQQLRDAREQQEADNNAAAGATQVCPVRCTPMRECSFNCAARARISGHAP